MQLQLVHRCFDTLRARFRTHAEDMHLHMREQCWVVVDTEECVAPATAHVIVFHGADNQTTTRTKMTGRPTFFIAGAQALQKGPASLLELTP